MKRFISCFMSFIFLFIFTGTDLAYGIGVVREISDEELVKICSSAACEGIDKESLNELKSDGLSDSEAEFYIRFDKIVKEIERKNYRVNLDKYGGSISDEEFAENVGYYRERILEGNREAMAKALLTIKNIESSGSFDDEICMAVSSDGDYERVFKDGSKISFSKRGEPNEPRDCESIISVANDGYQESLMEEGMVYPDDRTRFQEGEWKFQSGLSYSKVYMYVEYELDEENGISKISYARGGQSSYGVVNIANGTGAVIIREDSQRSIPAEARNEVIFNVTSSFGATFSILSVALNPGMNWTQYILFRLYPSDAENGGAKYQWYAAEYK